MTLVLLYKKNKLITQPKGGVPPPALKIVRFLGFLIILLKLILLMLMQASGFPESDLR